MNDTPNLMTHERIMTGEEYVSYSDYLKLQCERDEAQRELEMWKFERDEALEHAARYRLEANKLIMMGVELREQNAKLRDIAESAIWRMVNGVCLPDASAVRAIKEEGLRLRAELDQLKEGTK